MQNYAIVRCPYCGRYTYTTVKTKNRLCSYCGKIFKANENQIKIVSDLRTAQILVKKLNLKKGLQKDKRSGEYNTIQKEISSMPESKIPKIQAKRKRILEVLNKYARDNPIALDKFIDKCEKEHIEGASVFHILEILAEEGFIFFPEPHTIQYLKQETKIKKVRNTKGLLNVAKQILNLFKDKECLTEDYIITKMTEKEISEELIHNALIRLLDSGKLYQPKGNSFCIVQ